VVNFCPSDDFSRAELIKFDRSTLFAILAARAAIEQSGFSKAHCLGNRAGVFIGCASGPMTSLEESYKIWNSDPHQNLHPLTVPRSMPNGTAAQLSISFGAQGPSLVINAACASSAYAIAIGTQLIRAGVIDLAIVGGTEASLSNGYLAAWNSLRVLSSDTCRPFSMNRSGPVLGEGSGILVIESWMHALERGATVLGEIVGVSMNSDAHDLLKPLEEGQADAIRTCLFDAKLNETDIGYINAHGTGTLINDVTETRVIRRVFSNHADRLLVSSTKSMHGHTLGAAGAIEFIATMDALRYGYAPPTMNFQGVDPECTLNYVPNRALPLDAQVALSNSFGFGGHNAVLAIRCAR
jgi:nodulation protein E